MSAIDKLYTVDADNYQALVCALCGGELYLERAYCIPLYADTTDWTAADAVTNNWRVVCSGEGHVLATSAEEENAEPFTLDSLAVGYVYKPPEDDE